MINITERTKKILFIIFFITFTVATGYALYYFFFKPLVPSTPTSYLTGEEYPGMLEPGGERVITDVIPEISIVGLPTAETALDISETITDADQLEPPGTNLLRGQITQATSQGKDGSYRFYNPVDGRFYTIDENGNEVPLSQKQFYNVDKISWGTMNQEAILEFPDGSNIYYDFEKNRQVTLPKQWTDFAFAINDSKIVAKNIALDENNRYLITSEPDGNELTALYHMGANANAVLPSWSPNNQVVGFSKTGSPQADNAEEIYLLGKNHEKYKSLTVAGRGFQPNWSPTGNKLLYSAFHERDNFKPMLWVCDSSGANIGSNRKKLNLNTWANKCAWADDSTLYCGVPVDLPVGAGYDQSAFSVVSDDVYKINLNTGVATRINSDDQKHPISKPMLNPDKTKLIFTDSTTGYLYSYDLN